MPAYRLGIASVLPVCHAVCSLLQRLHGCSHIRESLLLTHFKHCRHSVFHSFTQPPVYPHPFVSARLRSHRLRYGIVLHTGSCRLASLRTIPTLCEWCIFMQKPFAPSGGTRSESLILRFFAFWRATQHPQWNIAVAFSHTRLRALLPANGLDTYQFTYKNGDFVNLGFVQGIEDFFSFAFSFNNPLLSEYGQML